MCTPDTTDVTGSHVEFTIQDLDSGLGAITAALATNADCAVPPFTPGTTDPVIVTCDAITAHQLAVVQIQATDVDGNTHDCDETFFNVEATSPICFASAALLGPAPARGRRRFPPTSLWTVAA
jgi:hypothetical protein